MNGFVNKENDPAYQMDGDHSTQPENFGPAILASIKDGAKGLGRSDAAGPVSEDSDDVGYEVVAYPARKTIGPASSGMNTTHASAKDGSYHDGSFRSMVMRG